MEGPSRASAQGAAACGKPRVAVKMMQDRDEGGYRTRCRWIRVAWKWIQGRGADDTKRRGRLGQGCLKWVQFGAGWRYRVSVRTFTVLRVSARRRRLRQAASGRQGGDTGVLVRQAGLRGTVGFRRGSCVCGGIFAACGATERRVSARRSPGHAVPLK